MPPPSKPPESPRAEPVKTSQSTLWQVLGSFIAWGTGLGVAGFLSLVLLVGVALAMAYPQLPDISDLADYRPKLSMRVFSAEGKVIGEFGEEIFRRLRHDRQRPLLQVDDPEKKLRELFAQRDPLYQETAHYVIESPRPRIQTMVTMVMSQLELAGLLPVAETPPHVP